MYRRHFLFTLGALAFPAATAARQGYAISEAERLIAAIQDGGKIVYLVADANTERSRRLGRALHALRVPLNDIRTGRTALSRKVAEAAFAGTEIVAATELDFRPDELLRTPPAPGHNRVLVGQRPALEAATGRRFTNTLLPDGAMAIFLPGSEIELLGTVTAERVIRGAETRGALSR
jgi:hypothetical protein